MTPARCRSSSSSCDSHQIYRLDPTSGPFNAAAAVGKSSSLQLPAMRASARNRSWTSVSWQPASVRILTANTGAWAPSRPGLKSRTVGLSIQVSATLRGKLDPPPLGPVHISITQTDYAGLLMMQPLPGVWPRGDLAPGTRLVVFAQSNDLRVESILAEPASTLVVPADAVLPGLRVAAQAEVGDLPLSRTLALAGAETARLDPIFADFLWGRYGGATMASQSDFDLLAGFAERKGLATRTRQALVKAGYDLVGLEGDDKPERAQRLALAMCRALMMSEAADIHENLIGTYLPNLLGITSELPPQAASAVFKGHEAERNDLKAFLHRHGTDADPAPLLAWLNGK
jgi:hypothetical protein